MQGIKAGDYLSIDDIIAANAARGDHFFEPATLRFFRSRVSSNVYRGEDAWYFVTSEQFCYLGNCKPRRYTVRRFTADGKVDTVGEFQAFGTWARAQNEARALAAD